MWATYQAKTAVPSNRKQHNLPSLTLNTEDQTFDSFEFPPSSVNSQTDDKLMMKLRFDKSGSPLKRSLIGKPGIYTSYAKMRNQKEESPGKKKKTKKISSP